MKQPIYNTALYLRLSRDDERTGESVSIENQRIMLRSYAQEHNLHVVDEYVDDGWSGTNYDRPSFQRMIDDIEDGKINCVVTKDLSRLGRNYILTGQYTEIYFPSKGVRYIAVNDNVDTLNGESELAPFLNILNEMHARQTSKKIKAALHVRRMNGGHWGSHTPLGYRRDPEQMGHLLIDPDTKWIVEKIFDLAAHGMGAAKITRILVEEQIPTPGWLHYAKEGTYAQFYQDAPEKKRYNWSIAAVRKILKDENYIGNSIHNRLSVVSFKNKKLTRNPESEWIRIEHTHEPIVSRDVFDQVQEQIASRRRTKKDGTTQMFAGLLRCADCGWTMRFGRQSNGTRPGYYACGKYYQTVDRQCSMHFIRYDVLYAYVLDRLQFWVALAITDEQELLERLLQHGGKNQVAERSPEALGVDGILAGGPGLPDAVSQQLRHRPLLPPILQHTPEAAEQRHHPGQNGDADQGEEDAVRQGRMGLIPAVERGEHQDCVEHGNAQPEFQGQTEQNGQQQQTKSKYKQRHVTDLPFSGLSHLTIGRRTLQRSVCRFCHPS